MSAEGSDDIEVLEQELKATLAAPRSDLLAFLAGVTKRLRGIPFSVDRVKRINCLLDIASLYYHQGQSTFSAVEPAALAVMLAREVKERELLRKALTIQGVILQATNNPGDAISALSEALEIAESIGDEKGRIRVWNNLGVAFYEAALYAEARDCWDRAVRLCEGDQQLRELKSAALANMGLACLHMKEFPTGLAYVRDAILLKPYAGNAAEMLARVLTEATHTRLLLALDRVSEAAERAEIAKELAEKAQSVRADVSAACSEGLVEVYSGFADNGLSRAMAALEKARAVKPSLRETLLAMIQAYEKAGRPDRALAMHRELTLHVRKAQHDSIVRHQELHLKQLANEKQFSSDLLEQRDRELQNQIAAQAIGTRQGDFLEQMAFTAEMRDDPSGEHIYRVARLAALLAKADGQGDEICEQIELAARLHDIGKVAIPDTLMQKSTPLTDGERQIIQTHASTGSDLISKSRLSYGELASEVARHHHERWDGNGYPDGISGSAIPLPARIVAVCDAYDSLTHEKPYRRALSSNEALIEIDRQKELQFDPQLVKLFIPLVQRLRAEHADLDDFLAEAAKNTALNIARQKIFDSLAKPIDGQPETENRQPSQPQQYRLARRSPVRPG